MNHIEIKQKIVSKNHKFEQICLYAKIEKDVIGFVIFKRISPNSFRLFRIEVLNEFQMKGLGTRLLNESVAYIKSISADMLITVYNENDSYLICKLLNRFSFDTPKYEYTHFRLNMQSLELNYFDIIFSDNFENNNLQPIYYNNISESQKNEIYTIASKLAPAYLFPFHNSMNFVPELSLFMFKNNVCVGWIINEKNNSEIHISKTFVVNEYKKVGLGLYMQYLIFLKIKETKDNIMYASFDIDENNTRLSKMCDMLYSSYIIDKSKFYSRRLQIL